MLNSKFDINSPEWIDRVFENRNKSYGAYDLRKQSAGTLNRALGITIFSFAAVFGISAYVIREKPASVAVNKKVDVTTKDVKVTKPEKDKNNSIRFNDAIVKPLPVGGASAWTQFLENNLRYPAQAKALRKSGTVVISFMVERDGSLSGIHADQFAGYGFDEEALRVIKLSPKWKPATQNGQTIRSRYSLPINFNIQVK